MIEVFLVRLGKKGQCSVCADVYSMTQGSSKVVVAGDWRVGPGRLGADMLTLQITAYVDR